MSLQGQTFQSFVTVVERAKERAVWAVGKVWSQELAPSSFNQSQSLSPFLLSLSLLSFFPISPYLFFFFAKDINDLSGTIQMWNIVIKA